MPRNPIKPEAPRIERLDPVSLEARLRGVAQSLHPGRVMDDLEVRHLVRVITECSLLLSDVYSEERITRIMHPDRGFLGSLIDQLIDEQRQDKGEVLYRVRRLPDDVRVIGDKALFDHGLLGQRQVRGYDLEELGARAYNVAGQVLEQLAEDPRLRRFFKQNRLLTLPLEEEVIFLRQCADRFLVYAEILRGTQRDATTSIDPAAEAVPAVLAPPEVAPELEPPSTGALVLASRQIADQYLEAARGETSDDEASREQLISSYERILLFSSLDIDRLERALATTVVHQDRAVRSLCDEFSLFASGTRDPRKPPAYFLVGPTGVGKNHLVESLCRTMRGIWKIDIPMLTIEGPSYTYPSDINELRGATRGFIRSDEEGLLTSFHEKSSRAPFGVILIDEVDKAHAQLLTFFLSILDRGTTTDNRGSVLNFANCMLFFTSNLGYSEAQQGSAPIGYHDEEGRERVTDRNIRRELRRTLKPEFVNRVRMVHFNRLSRASVEKILELELEKIARRYREIHSLAIEVEPSAREEIIRRGFSPDFGARHLTSTLEAICNIPVANRIRRDDQRSGQDRDTVIQWLREMREGERAFDAEQVKQRVRDLAAARLPYDRLRIAFEDGRFEYRAVDPEDDE